MFSLTLNDVLNVVRALLDIGLVWAVIFFGLRIVRNNSRTVQIFKGILFIFIVKGLAMLIGLTTINYIADMVLSWGVIVMVVIFQPEIRMLLDKAFESANNILCDHMQQLHTVAGALLEREKLSGDQFRTLMTGGELPPLEGSAAPNKEKTGGPTGPSQP